MGDKGFEVYFTLGSEAYRELVITRLEQDVQVKLSTVVMTENEAYSISEGTLNVKLLH